MGTKAIAKSNGQYLALNEANKDNVAALLKANLGDRRIDPWTFDTATWPSGKASVFEVPGLEGTEAVKELSGIILYWQDHRIFHEKDFDDGGSTPPDCSSHDLITGVGNPGKFTDVQAKAEAKEVKAGDSKCPTMKCDECWNAQFSTAIKGEGQACREKRQIFLLQEKSLLPLFIDVPPTSLKPFRDFFMRLGTKGKFFNAVVVKIALNKSKNTGGVEYAEANLSFVRDLTDDELESVRGYSSAAEKLFS